MTVATQTTGETAVAQRALQEVSRLVGEATERFQQDSYIEAMSSLTAIPSVLDPLIGFMGQTWVTEASGDHEQLDAQLGGQYL